MKNLIFIQTLYLTVIFQCKYFQKKKKEKKKNFNDVNFMYRRETCITKANTTRYLIEGLVWDEHISYT
jgi:hypothetical protein